jgi:hypothetical protein
VPALRATRHPARLDRLMRALLASGTATQPGRSLRRLRTDHPVDRRRTVSPLLGPVPAPAARPRHQPGRDTAPSAALAGRVRRLSHTSPPPRHACAILTHLGRLLLDAGPAHPQSLLERATGSARPAGPCPRGLLHQQQVGVAQRARGTPRHRPTPAPRRGRATTPAARCGSVRRAPPRRARTCSQIRYPTTRTPHARRPAHRRPGPGCFPRHRPRQNRLGHRRGR